MSAGEFIPEVTPSRECLDIAAYGSPSTVDSYIIKMGPQEPEDEFPTELCPPKYHSRAKIDNFKILEDLTMGGNIAGGVNISCSGTVSGSTGSFSSKTFNISHPTKDNRRLIHGCLEGPEFGVYIRGRVKNREEISFPDYWEGLVDWTTITVNLTPIGAHQNVIVKRFDENKVYLQSKGGMPIDCFYHIYATRKDIPLLEVEPEVDTES
tara:strand:+ start:93 stop:719 length:627 start_codon:yes stop_codon:yes gene_type:complete